QSGGRAAPQSAAGRGSGYSPDGLGSTHLAHRGLTHLVEKAARAKGALGLLRHVQQTISQNGPPVWRDSQVGAGVRGLEQPAEASVALVVLTLQVVGAARVCCCHRTGGPPGGKPG